MKGFTVLILCFIAFQSMPGAVAGQPFDLKWGATDPYSGLYANTTSIVNVVNQTYPHDIAATVVDTEGFADNLKKIRDKSIHVGPSNIVEAYAAFRGTGDYTASAIPGLRSLWGGYITPIHIIAGSESAIAAIDQIDGSTFAMNPGTTSGRLVKMLFDALEINPDYKPYSIALSKEAMRSGAVKCWYKAGYRDDAVVELQDFMDIKILPVTQAMIGKMNAAYPGYGLSVTIPAGLYRSVTEDQLSLAYVVSDFVHKDVPEDIVYKIVRAVWEKRRQLARSLSTLEHGRFEALYDMAIDTHLSVPFHPGAVRFYRERVTTDIPARLLPPER